MSAAGRAVGEARAETDRAARGVLDLVPEVVADAEPIERDGADCYVIDGELFDQLCAAARKLAEAEGVLLAACGRRAEELAGPATRAADVSPPRATGSPCLCGGGRKDGVELVDFLAVSREEWCGCTRSGVHTACVGHCDESAERARLRRSAA